MLSKMRRHGTLSATAGVLWLCATVAGCVQVHQRNQAPIKTVQEAEKRAPSEKNRVVSGNHADVRHAGFLDTEPTPPNAPIRPSPHVSMIPTSPEEMPLPQGVPAENPSGMADPTYSVKPPTTAGGEKLITLHVDDLDVRKALEILSRQADMGILVSPGVSGNVTLDLRDKTADEILQAIARLCRLKIQCVNGMIFVTARSESPEGEDGNLPVRVYHLDYVKSADVQAMIEPLLSPRGTISSSPDSEVGIEPDVEKAGGNAMAGGDVVIVQDYENVLKAIDRVIAQIDVQPLQVLIEAVIVSVKLNKGMELGVNFALLDSAQNTLGVVGSGAAINAATGFPPASVITSAGKLAGTTGAGFSEVANGLKFGFVADNTTSFIRALESLGETKVLACPRLLVLNKQRAEIQLGDRLGYKTSTQTQTSTVEKVEFMDVGTLLRIRPFISSDGMVRMEIHPERSSGHLDTNDVPQTNTAQVTTNVLVPDGTTIVIGGLMDYEIQVDYVGLPFLSRLPWIGSLFRETTTKRQKKELIVILTPHIWRPDMPRRLNHLGPPRSLGLESRVSTLPKATGDDPPGLFVIPPQSTPSDISPPPRIRLGHVKPKRQTPSDFYAIPRPAPEGPVGMIEFLPPGENVIPFAPLSDTPHFYIDETHGPPPLQHGGVKVHNSRL